MPIVLSQPFVPDVPQYDKVHLDHLILTLEKTDYAKAQIQARIRMYYQDPNTGVKSFSPETREITVEDCEAFAVELAQNGDMRGAAAMENIKEIVAFLVETKTDLGTTSVT